MTRLLLNADLSGRAIGRALLALEHDIRALEAEKKLERLKDVLELAISEDRQTSQTTSPTSCHS